MAQEKLNKLIMPTSPASSILEIQPKTILSPKSYQALETALYSNFINSDGNAIVPNDFSLEFTPYWTKNHGLSLQEYLYPKSIFDQFIRNLSFSVASTQNFLLGDSSATNGIAFGYRTSFYFGNANDRKEVEGYRDSLQKNQSIQIKIVGTAENLIVKKQIANTDDFLIKIKSTLIKAMFESGNYKNIGEVEKLYVTISNEASIVEPLDLENPDEFLDNFYSIIDKSLNASTLFNEFKSYIKERQGFSVDVAYAHLLNFPTNNFEFSYVPRQSLWITPTYRLKNKLSFLKVMGVIRLEWYNTGYFRTYFPGTNTNANSTDYGLAIAAELNKFSFQFEMVGRSSNSEIPAGTDDDGNQLFRKEQNSDFQYIASFSYNLTDQIVISYNLGNRFEPIQNPENTLVSILSLNLGFGSPTEDDLDLEN